MVPFIIYTLPRSRSAWLQHWLCDRQGLAIGHDAAMTCSSVDEFVALWDRGMTGTIETGAIIGWRLLAALRPGLRTAVVFRPLDGVLASLAKVGIPMSAALETELQLREALMQDLAAQPGVFSCQWRELSEFETAKRLWHHCTAEKFDEDRWSRACGVNIQLNVLDILAYLQKNLRRVEGLKREVAVGVAALREAGGQIQCLGLH